MNSRDVFKPLTAHMVEGMMFHEQLANYFDFLNLQWYRKCQERQHIEETYSYRKITSYYINHYNELVQYAPIDSSSIIPSQWYQHNRYDVDPQTKKTAIKNGFELWVQWEQKTKSLYEQLYNELVMIQDIAGAEQLRKLILDVDKELAEATQTLLNLIAVDFDLDVIIPEQKDDEVKIKLKF